MPPQSLPLLVFCLARETDKHTDTPDQQTSKQAQIERPPPREGPEGGVGMRSALMNRWPLTPALLSGSPAPAGPYFTPRPDTDAESADRSDTQSHRSLGPVSHEGLRKYTGNTPRPVVTWQIGVQLPTARVRCARRIGDLTRT